MITKSINQGNARVKFLILGVGREVKADPGQKRYSVKEKAEFIEYMAYREGSEGKANVTWYAERHGVSRTTMYNLTSNSR